MDQYKPKQLKFEDYLSFFQDHRVDKLTYSQLNQILFMHGFVKLNNHTKEETMNAVSSLDLVMPTRSTITSSIDSPMSPLSLVEVQLNIREMEWEECPIGSVMSFEPAGYCAASGNTSSLLTVVSELTGIRTEEKKIKKEKIYYTTAGLVAEPLPVKKTMRLPVGSLKDHDVYSWHGNGTKKKENIVYRWYYRCKTKSCPVRKTVFKDPKDSSMCFITYTGEHNHSIP
ncbi:putative WRKY transcription factor 14 [Carex rostrata]